VPEVFGFELSMFESVSSHKNISVPRCAKLKSFSRHFLRSHEQTACYSFSLNGRIKTKNGYFHKILKNNRDKQQINSLFLVLFFCLINAGKIRNFENN
jgi:hypothetical protein